MKKSALSSLILSLVLLVVCCSILPASTTCKITGDDGFQMSTTHVHHEPIEIDGDDDFITTASVEGWSGDGTTLNPFVITGYLFDEPLVQPVRIWNTDLHWEFRDNIIDTTTSAGVVCGVWIDDAANGLVTNNTIRNRHSGLVIISSDNLRITGNYVHNNSGQGLETTGYVEGIEISGNTFSNNNGYGVFIQVGSDISIHGNTVANSHMDGMRLGIISQLSVAGNTVLNSRNGLELVGPTDGDVAGNTIMHSSENGILIDSGNRIDVTGNTIMDNDGYGVCLDDSTRNTTVERNSFLRNGDTCQTCDDGEDNVFIYNHYDDWISPDADLDNIVDEPYEIEGTAQNSDQYPRADPSVTIPTSPPIPSEPIDLPWDVALVIGGLLSVVLVGGVFVYKRTA